MWPTAERQLAALLSASLPSTSPPASAGQACEAGLRAHRLNYCRRRTEGNPCNPAPKNTLPSGGLQLSCLLATSIIPLVHTAAGTWGHVWRLNPVERHPQSPAQDTLSSTVMNSVSGTPRPLRTWTVLGHCHSRRHICSHCKGLLINLQSAIMQNRSTGISNLKTPPSQGPAQVPRRLPSCALTCSCL